MESQSQCKRFILDLAIKKAEKLAVQKWGVGIRRPPFVTIRGELPAMQAMNVVEAIRGNFEAISGHVLGKKDFEHFERFSWLHFLLFRAKKGKRPFIGVLYACLQ